MFNKNKPTKLELANSKVESAVNMFVKANEDLESSNEILREVRQSDIEVKKALLAQIEELENEIALTETNIQSNNQLKEKLAQFLPN